MMNQTERDNLCFLQALSQFLKMQEIHCSFQIPPRVDRNFWDCAAEKVESPDGELLEAIAQCVRKDTSDFHCIEEIFALLEARGFSTSPRHDFG